MIYLFHFFVYLLSLKSIPRLKIKLHSIPSGMSHWIFKLVKSCARKMVKRTKLLLNSKMVKSFLGRSNSNFGWNQLTSMVDMQYRIITGKFQPLKQGLQLIVHTRIFKIATFQEWRCECKFWNVLYYYKHYEMLIRLK